MGLIRLVLALSVAAWHVPGATFRLLNFAVAVLFFFIISGFYMALVINEKYADSSKNWVKQFYLARFFRLYPAYATMCLVMVVWFIFTKSPTAFTVRLPMESWQQILLIISNVFILGQDSFEFARQAIAQQSAPQALVIAVQKMGGVSFFNTQWMLVGQAWSLSTEAVFYAIAPFVVRSPLRIVLVLACSLAIRFAFIFGFGLRSGVWGYWFFPATLCMFMLGALSYHVHRRLRVLFAEIYSRTIGWSLLVAFFAWFLQQDAVHHYVLASDATGGIDQLRFWVAYCLLAASLPFIFAATKNSSWDRAIGELSYPLYLVHGLVVGIAYIRWGAPKGSPLDMVIVLGVAVLMAWLMYMLVEQPIERRRHRIAAEMAADTSPIELQASARKPSSEG